MKKRTSDGSEQKVRQETNATDADASRMMKVVEWRVR